MSTNVRNNSKSKPRRSRSRSPVKSILKSKSLLISNIPFATTFNDLKDLFKEKIGICGKLNLVERNGKFTGNATMEFKTLEGAQKAVDTMHKYEINGREIIVREESNKDRERLNLGVSSNTSSLPSVHSDQSLSQLVRELEREGTITNSLFIANLDFGLSWQKLKDIFKSAGRVRHVELKTDVEGKSRGFGTVEFETPEEAILAIHLFNNKIVSNREMKLRMDKSGQALSGRLNLSKYMENDNIAPPSHLTPQISRLFEDILSASTNPSRKNPQALKALDELLSISRMFESPSMQHQSSRSDDERNFGFGNMSRRGGELPFGNDDYFPSQRYDSPYDRGIVNNKSSMGYDEYACKPRDYPPVSSINCDYNESPRNNGSFNMNTLEDLLLGMKRNGSLDQGSLMNVISNVMRQSPDSYSRPDKSRSNARSSGGMQPATLLIKNIPFSYTQKDLKISFSQVPGIEHVEILRDTTDRSKGVGLARFESSADAVRCKNLMDGTLLDGRPIHIEFYHAF